MELNCSVPFSEDIGHKQVLDKSMAITSPFWARFSSIDIVNKHHTLMSLTRRNKIWIAITAAVLIGGLSYCYFLRTPDARKEEMTVVSNPTYRTQIDGLRFFETRRGQKVVSITADRFMLGRGKVGFFSTGRTRRATIQNAVIEIYADAQPSAPVGTKPVPEGSQDDIRSGKNVAFNGLFAGETFSTLLPVRNIAEIVISPITLTLRNERTVLTSITAVKATVLLRERRILFTGQVRVSSGKTNLATEQLVFIPETSRLQTDHSYILKRGNTVSEGNRLTSDIFLKLGTATE
jgi:hypothetical protein